MMNYYSLFYKFVRSVSSCYFPFVIYRHFLLLVYQRSFVPNIKHISNYIVLTNEDQYIFFPSIWKTKENIDVHVCHYCMAKFVLSRAPHSKRSKERV